jgi:hypothetical protein
MPSPSITIASRRVSAAPSPARVPFAFLGTAAAAFRDSLAAAQEALQRMNRLIARAGLDRQDE